MSEEIKLGWEEWVSLPDLGLPALRAKVDTGARTSALHAYEIERFGPASKPKVRFAVHPIPGRDDLSIPCSAEIIEAAQSGSRRPPSPPPPEKPHVRAHVSPASSERANSRRPPSRAARPRSARAVRRTLPLGSSAMALSVQPTGSLPPARHVRPLSSESSA